MDVCILFMNARMGACTHPCLYVWLHVCMLHICLESTKYTLVKLCNVYTAYKHGLLKKRYHYVQTFSVFICNNGILSSIVIKHLVYLLVTIAFCVFLSNNRTFFFVCSNTFEQKVYLRKMDSIKARLKNMKQTLYRLKSNLATRNISE